MYSNNKQPLITLCVELRIVYDNYLVGTAHICFRGSGYRFCFFKHNSLMKTNAVIAQLQVYNHSCLAQGLTPTLTF